MTEPFGATAGRRLGDAMRKHLSILLLALVAACGTLTAQASGAKLDTTTTGGSGSNVVVRLSIDSDGTALQSLDAVVHFDAAKLRLLSITRNAFTQPLFLTTSCGDPCSAPSGSVSIALFASAPLGMPDGDKEVLWLEFQSLATGTSPVTLSDTFINGDTPVGVLTPASVTSSTDTPAFALPHDASAAAGGTTTIPLTVRPIGPWVSFDTHVQYNPAVVTVQSVALAPATAGFTLTTHVDNVAGDLTISLFRATSTIADASAASIALITLHAVGALGAETPLDIVSGSAAQTGDVDAVALDDGRFKISPDGDGDGWTVFGGDCNDGNASIHPGATEVTADGTDQDCDGLEACFTDADHDSYGSSIAPVTLSADLHCAAAGTSPVGTDCNDGNAAINPGATEVCDVANTDEDCDGLADDADASATGKATWYTDADHDTFGNAGTAALRCHPLPDQVANGADCNDANAAIHPGATEVCDASNTDEDCNGLADDADVAAAGKTPWYVDADHDTYGNPALSALRCHPALGEVANDLDCNDASAAVHPGATEVCDASSTDEDCNGLADDADPAATGKTTWYADADGDHYGNPGASALRCHPVGSQIVDGTDCDDTNPAIHPGAPEGIADGVDENCDGEELCYGDVDNDHYGTGATVLTTDIACAAAGHATVSTDCNDDDANVHPGATEVAADGIDENCDGSEACYTDLDHDTYGTPATTLSSNLGCSATGLSVRDDDCDDGNAAINPGALEVCDGIDNDCNGVTDSHGTRFVRVGGADGLSTCTAAAPGCASIAHAIAVSCAGETIDIGAGTFVENVRVPKPLTLHGAGEASTTLVPAVSNPNPCSGSSLCGGPTAASNVVLVESSSVTVEHLTVDGANPAVTSSITVGGVDIDARNGIIEYYPGGVFDNTVVSHVTVRNIFLRGVYFSGGGSGFVADHVTVDNVRGDYSSIALFNFGGAGTFSSNTVSRSNDGIVANWSRGTSFTANTVTCDLDPGRVYGVSALHTDNAGGAGGVPDLLSGNSVSGCDYGLFVFVPYVAPTVSANTVSHTFVGLAAYAGAFEPEPTVTAMFLNNNIGDVDLDGTDECATGAEVSTSALGYGATDVKVQLDGNTIRRCTKGVVLSEDIDTSKSVTLTGAGNTITGSVTGVDVAAVVSGSINLGGNRIFGNTHGFANPSAVSALAECTWWGDGSGPAPTGTGNDVSSNVDYSPWSANAALTPVTIYRDADGDSFGTPSDTLTACGPPYPAPYITTAGDCDDARAATHPGADELCNGLDDDCDTVADGLAADAFCSDSNTCTTDRCIAAACDHTLASGVCSLTASLYYGKVTAGVDGTDTSNKIAGTQIHLTADTGLPPVRDELTATDINGQVTFLAVDGNVVVAPLARLDTIDVLEQGVDSQDASLIAQHVVGVASPPLTPRQLLLGDASGNGSVTSFDASLCVQLHLHLISRLPKATLVSSDWAYFPASLSYAPITATASPVFTTALWGDVDNNWTSSAFMAPPAAAPVVTSPVTPSTGAQLYLVSGPRRLSDGRFELTLGLAQADGILGVDTTLKLGRGVRIADVRTTGIASGFTALHNAVGTDQRIALFRATPMVGTGPFLVVTYEQGGVANGLPFAIEAQANEGAIPLSLAPGLRH